MLGERDYTSETAFSHLFETYKNRIYGYILTITHSPISAEELTQEIFLKLWIIRDELINVQNLDGYIFKIARNKTLNYLRKASYDEKFLKDLQGHMVTDENNVDRQINMRQYEHLLNEAIQSLSPQRKAVYELSRHEGLTFDQIAQRLGLSRNTVRNHLVEALKKVREHFIRNDAGMWGIIYFLIC